MVEWTTDGSLSIHEVGEWFFALLACVDAPLAVPTTKKLRVFALKCRDLRKKIASEKNLVFNGNIYKFY